MLEHNANMDEFLKCAVKKSVPERNVWQSESWWYACYIGRQCPCIQCSEKLASWVQTWQKQCQGWACSGRPKDAASTENVQIITCWKKTDVWPSDILLRPQTFVPLQYIKLYRMKKVSARWVPRMLMDKQKQNHVDVCTDLLCHLQA